MISTQRLFKNFKIIQDRQGSFDLTTVIFSITISSILALILSQTAVFIINAGNLRVLGARDQVILRSAIETFMLAWRAAEFEYIEEVCPTAHGLGKALQGGSGCSGSTVSVFTGSLSPGHEDLYSLSECDITETAGCPLTTPFVAIEGDAAIGFTEIEFFLHYVPHHGHYTEWRAIFERPEAISSSHYFQIPTSYRFAAHLESDGRVTAENPDPMNPCGGMPWANLQLWDPTSADCHTFGGLGGGTGLIEYKNRFFGLRASDGTIVDLKALADGNSYVVGEDGKIDGNQIFVPYPAPGSSSADFAMFNVDDATLIGEGFYFVRADRMWVLHTNGTDWIEEELCNLRSLSYNQGITGIRAGSLSDPLVGVNSGDFAMGNNRFATFYLKTDQGGMLQLRVRRDTSGYHCSIVKDMRVQAIEYNRTFGFEGYRGELPFIVL